MSRKKRRRGYVDLPATPPSLRGLGPLKRGLHYAQMRAIEQAEMDLANQRRFDTPDAELREQNASGM